MNKKIIIKTNEEKIVPVLWMGKETEMAYDITLAEKGASVKFLGLLLGKENQQIKLSVTVTHLAPETTSYVVIKSVLRDQAKVAIDGLVKINKHAKGTNAWLAAHLLLLSERAKGLAIPSLEILENDIKAGHATTVGRISDQEMFYLMSRGLPKDKAKELIVEGFLQSMIDVFPKKLSKKAQFVILERSETKR